MFPIKGDIQVKVGILALLSILFIFAFSAFTEDNEVQVKKNIKKEKAEKVISLTRISEIYVDTLLENLKQAPISEEDKKLYHKFATSESLAEKFVPAYMEFYTEEELDAMIKFYSSPEGASIIQKGGDVVGKIRTINLEWEIEVSAKVRNEKAKKAIESTK